MTSTQRLELVQLSEKIQDKENQVLEIRSMCDQLASDRCTATFSMKIHNERIHEENKGHRFDRGGVVPEAIQDIEGFILNNMRPYTGHLKELQPCTTTVSVSMPESTALRMLDKILLEQKKELDLLAGQLRDLLHTISNPIH
jgi:hypothetical protein